MDAKGYLLTQVLGNVRLEIPPWQRRYSWKEENWEALWRSLQEVSDGRKVAPHFLGALVFQGDKVKSGIVQHRIIDGQQRMITLSLVLAAIRRKLAAYPETTKRQSELASVTNLLFSPGGSRREDLKVVPYGLDLDAFWSSVDTLDASSGQIGDAYEFFSKRISPLNEKQLVSLRDGMSGRLFFAVVYLSDKEDANRIFRSLNESGLTLSPTDHIRNQLFMSAGTRGDALYKAHWEPLESSLGGDLLSFLFADLARQPHDAQSLQKSQLHRVYAPRFEALAGKPELVTYIETLERDGRLYRASRDPSLLDDAGIANGARLGAPLEHLTEWGSQPAETSVLDVLVRYVDGNLQLSQVIRALHSIESFLVRRFLAGERANLLSRIFTDLINQFPTDGTGTYAARLRQALSHPGHSWPTTAEVTRSVTTVLNFYVQGSGPQRKYILKELNCHLVDGGKLKRDAIPPNWPADITVEHIMPQTLDEWWRSRLEAERQSRGWTESVEDLHAAHVNVLGNLTLARQDRNDQYGNKSFPEKVALINQELPIRLNASLGTGDYSTWGIEAIRKRSADLASLACRIWEGPSGR
jgi:hypothetical protein